MLKTIIFELNLYAQNRVSDHILFLSVNIKQKTLQFILQFSGPYLVVKFGKNEGFHPPIGVQIILLTHPQRFRKTLNSAK